MRKTAFRKILGEIIINGLALLTSGIVCGIIVAVFGENPIAVFSVFVDAAFGSASGIMYTLFYATPLIFTGLSVGIAFKAGLFNIGAEGQLYIGAFAAAWIGITFTSLPGWLLVPLTVCGAALAGAVWGWIPGYFKGKFGSHEVINTIMMNYIAIGIMSCLVSKPFKEMGNQIPQTREIAQQAHIPLISELLAPIGIHVPESVPLNAAFILAVIVAGVLNVILWKSAAGFEIRATGASPAAAGSAGINTAKTLALTMALSGAVAGLVGVNEVLGYRHRFLLNFSSGYGFTGIAIALMGKNHPVGIIFSALLFGAIMRGGLILDIYFQNISRDIIYIFQGIIILFIAARAFHSYIKKKSSGVTSPEIFTETKKAV